MIPTKKLKNEKFDIICFSIKNGCDNIIKYL